MEYRGKSICLYGDSGSGKSTQAGELAKYVRKSRGCNSVLFTSDLGGYDSISALVRAGVIRAVDLGPDSDPWIWIDDAVSGKGLADDVGLAIFDSATSMSEALLSACSHADFQIGQQRTQRFQVSKGGKNLNVSINNEAHYGVVQGFMLDAIWKSTWLTRRGIDVLWTFSVHRGEEQDRTPILGPKLAGKALTAAIPKWFKYTFRIASVPQTDTQPIHRLYLTEHPELAGLGHSFGNARFPLGVGGLPPYIEPASIPKALELIQEGQNKADEQLKTELGL
jgi:energy-coupling factor transporter ATP-binding protein EcfA2